MTRTWGERHGVCRGCARETWYFTFEAFSPQGAAAVFRAGRVVALFTVWQPSGWRASSGLRLGDAAGELFERHRPLNRVVCGNYDAWIRTRAGTVSAFYVYRDALWAFALTRPGEPVCR